MNVEHLSLESGRRVAVHRVAEGSGRTILFCHAAPGSGGFDPDPRETQARDITLLAVDRPGYGGSDPVGDGEWASVGAAADDLADVLRELGIDHVGVAGWSAGGRVALALAARHPDLVDRAAVVATPAPHDEVPWIPPEQAAGIEALRGQPPDAVHAALAAQLAGLVPARGAASSALEQVATPADEPVLRDADAAARLAAMLEAAYAQGATGIAEDIAGYSLQPWGFEPADVATKTLLVYGGEDPIAGGAHGRWWQRQLPNARLEMTPGAGHLLIVERWARILSFLAPDR
jgi:pimeloyl-ACP methyl ester carboxylesterase